MLLYPRRAWVGRRARQQWLWAPGLRHSQVYAQPGLPSGATGPVSLLTLLTGIRQKVRVQQGPPDLGPERHSAVGISFFPFLGRGPIPGRREIMRKDSMGPPCVMAMGSRAQCSGVSQWGGVTVAAAESSLPRALTIQEFQPKTDKETKATCV